MRKPETLRRQETSEQRTRRYLKEKQERGAWLQFRILSRKMQKERELEEAINEAKKERGIW